MHLSKILLHKSDTIKDSYRYILTLQKLFTSCLQSITLYDNQQQTQKHLENENNT
jgi:hypothetical protein